jgi:hypothetical protein
MPCVHPLALRLRSNRRWWSRVSVCRRRSVLCRWHGSGSVLGHGHGLFVLLCALTLDTAARKHTIVSQVELSRKHPNEMSLKSRPTSVTYQRMTMIAMRPKKRRMAIKIHRPILWKKLSFLHTLWPCRSVVHLLDGMSG